MVKYQCFNNNNMKFKPLATRVIVLVNPDEVELVKGVMSFIPEKVLKGVVQAVGPGTKKEPMEIKIGDEISYGKNSGTEVEIEGGKYLIMRQSAINGIIL